MTEVFGNYGDAVRNTVKIASECDFKFNFDNHYLPSYKPENGMKPSDYLRKLVFDGLALRLESGHMVYTETENEKLYTDRIEYELSVIGDMGYSEYFLIVWDFVHYSKSHGITVGPGRGSSAGSIVAYLIGIVDINPIKYGLLFERFLNPKEVSMPDFDIDFSYDRRDEAIEYVKINTAVIIRLRLLHSVLWRQEQQSET